MTIFFLNILTFGAVGGTFSLTDAVQLTADILK